MAEARQQIAGDADLPLAQDAAGRLIVAGAAAVPMPMDLKQYLNAPCGPANPIDVQDTGLNTNPRRYESDYGFVSSPIAVAGGPTATKVWAVGTACVRNPSGVPANGRTAGHLTTVYTMELRNPDAAAQTAWLETTGGIVVSVVYEIAAADTLIVDFVAGKTFGDMDLYVNGSVAAIECQLEGTEV